MIDPNEKLARARLLAAAREAAKHAKLCTYPNCRCANHGAGIECNHGGTLHVRTTVNAYNGEPKAGG